MKPDKEKLRKLVSKMNKEGFEYFFCDYTGPEDSYYNVGDAELTRLWNLFSSSRDELQDHIRSLCSKTGVNADGED